MIVRGFYRETLHETRIDYAASTRQYCGARVLAVTEPVVRTWCDQFITTAPIPVVVVGAIAHPTCVACREALRIDMARARATVDADA